MDPMADAPIAAYLERLSARTAGVLGDSLVGVYLRGSAVLGGFARQRSDLDLLVVAAGPLGARAKGRLAAELSPEAMPCPAERGLELSVVTLAAALAPTPGPRFGLHLASAGPGGPARVVDGRDCPGDPDLLLHFAVCREHGRPLSGPPPPEVFAPVRRAWLLRGMERELAWAREHAPAEYQVLNACRAWRFAEENVLCSKLDGGRWARDRLDDPLVVDLAIARQSGRSSRAPEDAAAAALLERVLGRLG
jgi:Aminoglycoside adenylyltransferase, C-terminal domain